MNKTSRSAVRPRCSEGKLGYERIPCTVELKSTGWTPLRQKPDGVGTPPTQGLGWAWSRQTGFPSGPEGAPRPQPFCRDQSLEAATQPHWFRVLRVSLSHQSCSKRRRSQEGFKRHCHTVCTRASEFTSGLLAINHHALVLECKASEESLPYSSGLNLCLWN